MKSRLEYNCFDLCLAGLPAAFDGLKILQISDLHLRRRAQDVESNLLRYLEQSRAQILVFTGDMVNNRGTWPRAGRWLEQLPSFPFRFAVPGNWDYGRGATPDAGPFAYHFEEAGFRVLRNRAHCLQRGESSLYFVGLDDPRNGRVDIPAAYAGIPPDACVVALCHSPDILGEALPVPCSLLLCGHTHGGQWRLPGYGAFYTSTRLGKQYEAGLYTAEPGRHVYVNRGIGAGPIPWRFNCRPEVTVFTLRSGAQSEAA